MPSKGQLDSRSMPHRPTGVPCRRHPRTLQTVTPCPFSVSCRRTTTLGRARDRQAHPSFCAARVRDWDHLLGDWSQGHWWEAAHGRFVADVGWEPAPECSGDSWTPLLRSSRADAGIVNHHDAHFPWAGGRVDLVHIPRLNTGPSTVRASAGRGSPRTRTAVKAGRGSNMTRHSSANQSNKPRLAHPQYNGSGLRNRKGG